MPRNRRNCAAIAFAAMASLAIGQSHPADTVEGFVVPSSVTDREPFTFAAKGVLEGEVVEVKTLEGEVVTARHVDKYGRVFLQAGLAAGTYLLTKSSGGQSVRIQVGTQPNDIPPFGTCAPIQRTDSPITVSGAVFDGLAANSAATLGGHELPVLAESTHQVVLASPLSQGLGPSHALLKVEESGGSKQVLSQEVAICTVTAKLARSKLLSGEQTTLGFSIAPKDVDADIQATILDGPIQFAQGRDTLTLQLRNGQATAPIKTVPGGAGAFHIAWVFNDTAGQGQTFDTGGDTKALPVPPGEPIKVGDDEIWVLDDGKKSGVKVEFIRHGDGSTTRTETRTGEHHKTVKSTDTKTEKGKTTEVDTFDDTMDGVRTDKSTRDTYDVDGKGERSPTKHEVWDPAANDGQGGWVAPPKK